MCFCALLTNTSSLIFRRVFFSFCFGVEGAINFVFLHLFGFEKGVINWTDSSVLVVSPLPVVFTIIVKHCLWRPLIPVRVLAHTGARVGVKL